MLKLNRRRLFFEEKQSHGLFSHDFENQKGIVHLFVPIILLIGLIAGVYLVTSGNPLKIFPQASNPPIVFKSSDGQYLPINRNNVTQTTSPIVRVEITSTLGPPATVSGPVGSARTVAYRSGFRPADLDKASFVLYKTEPTVYNVRFKNTKEIQFYWVEFKAANGKTDRRMASIQVISAPISSPVTPTPTPVTCSSQGGRCYITTGCTVDGGTSIGQYDCAILKYTCCKFPKSTPIPPPRFSF